MKKKAQRLKNHRLVDLILSNVADGVFTVDSQFRITFFNRAAEEITGFSNDEAVGRYCHEIFRTPICDQDCPLRQSLRTGRTVKNFEIDIQTQRGKRQAISVCTAPLVDNDGTFLGGVETFRDVSTIKELRKEISGKYTFQDIISKNPKMRQIFQTLPNIAQSDATVLLQGRSGTGKELFATAIHNLSPRANGPLVTVNCGALPVPAERHPDPDPRPLRAQRGHPPAGGTLHRALQPADGTEPRVDRPFSFALASRYLQNLTLVAK